SINKQYLLRRIAKPGITGLAQYREYCGAFEWSCVENRVRRDVTYIECWSLRLDIELVIKTLLVVSFGSLRSSWNRLFPRHIQPIEQATENTPAIAGATYSADSSQAGNAAADDLTPTKKKLAA
ncbi:MAG: sugar transferase, partial [Planctomycetaceae bacterium]|nr:sugar transferase [Planctomycetaceae bacterium]